MTENTIQNPHAPVAPEEDASGEQPGIEAVEGASTGEGESAFVDGSVEPIIAVSAEAAVAEAAPDTSSLRPIGEATYGRAERHGLGASDRDTRIQIANTGDYPWRAHCSLLITANDGSQWIGTGWFIGPQTLVTAGHCVFIKNAPCPGATAGCRAFRVMPGRNGATLPYGSVTVPRAICAVWPPGPKGNEEFDYGALVLPTPLGDQTGWFGFASLLRRHPAGADGEHLRLSRRQALRALSGTSQVRWPPSDRGRSTTRSTPPADRAAARRT